MKPELKELLKAAFDKDLLVAAGDEEDSLTQAGLIQIVRNTGYVAGIANMLEWFQNRELGR